MTGLGEHKGAEVPPGFILLMMLMFSLHVIVFSNLGGRLFCRGLKMTHRVFLCSPFRFQRGFESEPTLHSGINYAVLLLAAGHQFETSFELRKVGRWALPVGTAGTCVLF